jgi:hypothetical protein
VHRLQGKAEVVTTAELVSLLESFHRERQALHARHVNGAEAIADYEFNNTYQYIIAREETHLRWVADATADLGGTVPAPGPALAVPTGKGTTRETAIITDDAVQQQAFIDRWRPRLETIGHVRHRNMLRVILGEMQEHMRFFDLALEGRDDLLGRRMPGASTGDGVLPVRWVE